MKLTEKLAPCPFCGAEDRDDNAIQESAIVCRIVKTPIGKRGYEVECICGGKGPRSLDHAEAVAKWNHRPQRAAGFYDGMSQEQRDGFRDMMRRRMGGE